MSADRPSSSIVVARPPTYRLRLAGLRARWQTSEGLPLKFVWTLLGNLAVGASQVLALCLIAKITTVHHVGEYSLATAIVAPVMALMSLQLRSIQASDSEGRFDFRIYLWLRCLANLLGFAIVLAITLASEHAGIVGIVIPVGLARIFVATSDVVHGGLQRHERMDRIAKSQTLSSLTQALGLVALLYATSDLAIGCYAMALGSLLVLVCYDLPTFQSTLVKNRGKSVAKVWWSMDTNRAVARLAWFALPLGLVTGGIVLASNVPRYFVGHHVDTTAVGVLTVLMVPGLVLQQIVTALSQTTLPRFGRYFAEKNVAAFGRLLKQVVAMNAALGILGVAVCAAIGQQILSALATSEFVGHGDVFIWIMVSFAINCVGAIGGTLTATRQFRLQLYITALSLLAMIAACLVLVPHAGLKGAAQALVIVASLRTMVVFGCVKYAMDQMRNSKAADQTR